MKPARAAALAIFARSPVSGKAKTRLVPLLGAHGAAKLQAALTADALRKFRPLRNRLTLFLMATGPGSAPGSALSAHALHDHRVDLAMFRTAPQRGHGLGERLQRAFRKLLREYSRAVVIGTDSPELSVRILLRAFRELLRSDAVLGPCPDGGYYLVGLRQRGASGLRSGVDPPRTLFRDIQWGTSRAFRDTMRNFGSHGLSCARLDLLEDIDRPSDLERLKERMAESSALRRRAPATWNFLRQVAHEKT